MIISPAFNRFVQPEFLSQTGVTSLFEFNDPRDTPKRALSKPAARTTGGPKDLSDLHRLCRDGRLHDVERCIQAGRPLQAILGGAAGQRRIASALEIALEAGDLEGCFEQVSQACLRMVARQSICIIPRRGTEVP